MDIRQTDAEMNRDDLQRPDGAMHDELGRTAPEGHLAKASPRQQLATAVHLALDDPKTLEAHPADPSSL